MKEEILKNRRPKMDDADGDALAELVSAIEANKPEAEVRRLATKLNHNPRVKALADRMVIDYVYGGLTL